MKFWNVGVRQDTTKDTTIMNGILPNINITNGLTMVMAFTTKASLSAVITERSEPGEVRTPCAYICSSFGDLPVIFLKLR